MDSTTLLVIVIVLIVLAGGAWYGRGRWFQILLRRDSLGCRSIPGQAIKGWNRTDWGETVQISVLDPSGNAAERAYRRKDGLDKRRVIMEAWVNHCAGAGPWDHKPQAHGTTPVAALPARASASSGLIWSARSNNARA